MRKCRARSETAEDKRHVKRICVTVDSVLWEKIGEPHDPSLVDLYPVPPKVALQYLWKVAYGDLSGNISGSSTTSHGNVLGDIQGMATCR